jgi:hypothetical protein
MYKDAQRIMRTIMRGSIGLGQIRIKIPRKIKNECQRVKVITSDTWMDWLIHSKRAIFAFLTPRERACA